MSLWDPLHQARGDGPLLSAWSDGAFDPWTWDEWRAQALRFAAGLRERGVRPGERVACLLTNGHDACAAVLGTWLAGGCLVSVPTIARGMALERYVEQLRRIVAQAEPVQLLCEPAFTESLSGAGLGVPVSGFDAIQGAGGFDPDLPGDDQPIFVQYSSGSTSDPHGCVLSAGAIARQLEMLAHAVELDPAADRCVSWLPLSHDMGLFGALLLHAYWTGTELLLSTPQRFVSGPRTWFGDCARHAATITVGPNFALDLAARTAAALPPAPAPIRRVVIGGEMVQPGTLQRALKALGPERLMDGALLPAYGLAESVLAVSTTPVGEGPTVLWLDPDALGEGSVRPVSEGDGVPAALAASGRPLPGVGVTIVRGEGDGGGDGVGVGADVGEICVQTPSLAEGYLGAPELTARKFTPGGLKTGDLGFLHEGRLFVTGRRDDLMTIAGRNVYARDIEAAIQATGHPRPGCCAVVPLAATADGPLVTVLEPVEHHPDPSVMARDIAAAARAGAAVRITECLFLPRGAFPKTPSGKVQRFRCRELALDRDSGVGKRVRVGGRTSA